MSSRLVFCLLLVALSIILVWAFRPPQGNADARPATPHLTDQGREANRACAARLNHGSRSKPTISGRPDGNIDGCQV